ncbi:sigma-54-dependent transcriptional regulator [bacterium]
MSEEKILIVDDDPKIRLVLADRLQASGFIICQAHNGKRGLEMVSADKPDLVLLDLQMPEMSGLEVLKRLLKDTPNLPVIILTAHGSIEHAVEAMKLGAYDFLPKPCKPDHILLVVQKALDQKSTPNKRLRIINIFLYRKPRSNEIRCCSPSRRI